jgi:hypothetical protein
MRIDHDGKVGIGDSSPDAALDVVGDIHYTGVLTDVSDERLKDNIVPVENALSKVQHLSGVYFNMKDTPDRRDVGLIAQNVQEVLPEAVSIIDEETGHLGVSYSSVVGLLVEAIKDTEAASRARNTTNQNEIAELRLRVEALERSGRASVVKASLPYALLGVFGLVALHRRQTKEIR